jgi:hypothetical protein
MKNKGCKELNKRKLFTKKEGKERMDTMRERREYLVHKLKLNSKRSDWFTAYIKNNMEM